ncbi:substrate-binding domain-containing protein [Svornostia abyssi]|uniref:Substrate-binding domain-containing protein n=1 Tax=Svornostia abyssi TaxID=2898438 RepID=A0ABY5PFV6_9ACTN|nr:substrate-binding domain-containing protein [Parviterribacteraceae bacterium J379]
MAHKKKLLPALALSALAVATMGAETAAAADCSPGQTRIQGRGASFQNQAHNNTSFGWIFSAACQVGTKDATSGNNPPNTGFNAGDDLVYYDGQGSGSGLGAFGSGTGSGPFVAPAGVRDNQVSFIGTDDPAAQGTGSVGRKMEEGPTGSLTDAENAINDADDGILHTIPVAQAALAVIVKAPLGCKYPASQAYIKRWKLPAGVPGATNSAIEKVFSGEYDTWGDLGFKENVTNVPCPKAIKRFVRRDNSGTTFSFKNFLNSTDEGNTTAWEANDQSEDDNTIWPNGAIGNRDRDGVCDGNDTGAGGTGVITGQYVCTGTANGNASLAAALNALGGGEGGIGYADLGTSRAAGFSWTNTADRTYWLPLYSPTSTTTLFDAQAVASAFKSNAPTSSYGSNCNDSTVYGLNGGNSLPVNTKADWGTVYQNPTAPAYPICTLTYIGAWEDYEDPYPDTELAEAVKADRQQVVENYLEYILGTDPLGVGTNEGQTVLNQADYSALPGTVRSVANTYFIQAQFDKSPDVE